MTQQNINSGKAPILWSTIDEAFAKINSNFTELYLSIGGEGTDLTNIPSSLIPDVSLIRDIGNNSRKWRDLYLSGNLYINDQIFDPTVVQGEGGIQGTQGVQGTQGLQGIQGTQGTQGLIGIQGTQGLQGSTGPQGTTGEQGIQGLQGLIGIQGTQGNIGIQGSTGPQGTTGEQGIQGLQGVQGTIGTAVLNSRTTVSGTAVNLGNGSSTDISITGFKSYFIYKIATSHASWVRIYSSQSARTTDSNRLETEEPISGSGVFAEVITTGNETVLMSPGVVAFNDESPPSDIIFLRITNNSGAPASITVTLTVIKTED